MEPRITRNWSTDMNWYKKAQDDKPREIEYGLINEGLDTEHEGIGQAVQRYSHDNDVSGIYEALNDPDYSAYYENLQRILKMSLGDTFEVRRKEGYAGGTGEGVGEYVSVSWFPTWSGKRYLINRADVVLGGYEDEGELIVKRSGLKSI